MFRENNGHRDKSMFCTIDNMDRRYAKAIEEGWAGQFYKYVFCEIDEKRFEPLYSKEQGRPNTAVNVLVGLEIIKHLWNYTDEQLMRAIRSDYEVNYALGIRELGSFYIADRTIYEFREKLVGYALDNPEEGDLVFNLFQDLTASFIKLLNIKSTEIRMDSTLIASNIKKAGRLALAFDVLHLALKVIPRKKLTKSLSEVLEPKFKTSMLYKVKGDQAASNLDKLLELANQTLKIANKIPEVSEKEEILILRRFIDEQTDVDEKTGQRSAKPSSKIKANSLQSAYDPDATFRQKGDKKSSGYVVNIAETCNKENSVQMIVDYAIEKNITSDQELLKNSLPILQENTDVEKIYVDGGYTSTELWQDAQSENIDIAFTDMVGKKPERDKIPYSSFNVDIDEKILVSCPAGQKPLYSSFSDDEVFSARFDVRICKECLLAPQCPVKKKKRYSIIHFKKASYLAAKLREKYLYTEEHLENLAVRAGVEGTISGLKVGQRLANLPVRGLLRSNYYTGLKVAAANVKRLFRGIKYCLQKDLLLHHGRSVPILTS